MRRPGQIVRVLVRGVAVGLTLIGFVAAQVGFPIVAPPVVESSATATTVRPCGCVVTEEKPTCCCCCSDSSASCCEKPEPVSSSAQTEPVAEPTEPSPDITWVVGILAQQCRGLSTSWVTLGAVLPPPDCPRYHFDAQPGERVPVMPAAVLVISLDSIDPPPRLFV